MIVRLLLGIWQEGYVDFLYSLTDVQLLQRDGLTVPTSSFIDADTKSVDVVFSFIAPQLGMITVLDISIQFDASQELYFEIQDYHLSVMPKKRLTVRIVFRKA